MHLKYRPEIDGLRALAVLSVIVYHAEFLLNGRQVLEGGFIGVDIFFVISGYLITLIILREIQSGVFSFSNFYERRARRILPVLFVVMLCSTPLAWLYMLPDALKEYAASILSSLVFGSNFLFWQEDSYTAEPSALKPFLHTWSLSIEEQFYVVLPVLLIFLFRYAKNSIGALILVLVLISLAAAEYSSRFFPESAFYLLPARAWELLAGSLMAKLEFDKGRTVNPSVGKIMPSLGLILVVVSFFLFDKSTRHPSLWTVFPVVGTMLIIWFSSRGEWVTSLLSSRPFVGVGLISYSLYLWHFPVFAFDRVMHGDHAGTHKYINIGLTVLLAVMTYYFIERPARDRKLIGGKSMAAILTVTFMVLVTVSMYALVKEGRVINRAGHVQELINTAVRDNALYNDAKCHDYVKPCIISPTTKSLTITLVGDSHAGAISGELLRQSVAQGYGYAQFTSSACTHIQGLYNPNRNEAFNDKCSANAMAFSDFIRDNTDLLIVHMGYYPFWLSGKAFSNGKIVNTKQSSLKVIDASKGLSVSGVVEHEVKNWLAMGHHALLVYPVPEVGVHVPKYFSRLLQNEADLKSIRQYELKVSVEAFHERAKDVISLFDGIGSDQVIRVKPESVFCSMVDKVCYAHDNNGLFYTDSNHLSKIGAQKVVEMVMREISDQDWE